MTIQILMRNIRTARSPAQALHVVSIAATSSLASKKSACSTCLLKAVTSASPNARPRQTRDEAGGDRIADDWGQRLKSACSSQ
jgi:hypothetical protein